MSQPSAILPNALERRIAISGEIPRRAFTNSESVVRVTPSGQPRL
jgi:hypothetical protein